MPRLPKLKYSRKILKPQVEVSSPLSTTPISGQTTPSTAGSHSSSSSSSERKLGALEEYDIYDDNVKHDIIDIMSLGKFLGEFTVCRACGGNLTLDTTNRCGLAVQVVLNCDICFMKKSYVNSHMIERTQGIKQLKMYEINIRAVYSFRALGKGNAGANLFCGLMNLPPPPCKFGSYERTLLDASKITAERSMEDAVREATQMNDGARDIAVAVDGTWQKRGHVSLNGVVAATSVDTGKVVDVCALSKYCRCKNKSAHEPNCLANFQGTSGGMEVEGATQIFLRSLRKHNVRYTKFLGDGDSKAFKAVSGKNVYGDDCPITKLECIGHVQKRMGARLRAMKQRRGKTKLSDGKPLGGRGRLTDDSMTLLQKYYGQAIRYNLNSIDNMHKAVWAVFFHIGSSDSHPNHFLCPEGENSWCGYQKARVKGVGYNHNNHFHLDYSVMIEIKPIFKDLANPELLKRCLHGGTQNPNESFNNVLWNRVPKNTFVRRNTLKLGLYDAVGCFNDGHITKCRVYNELGIKPGTFCTEALKGYDSKRIKKASKDAQRWTIKARYKRSLARKKLEGVFQQEEEQCGGPSYSAGHY